MLRLEIELVVQHFEYLQKQATNYQPLEPYCHGFVFKRSQASASQRGNTGTIFFKASQVGDSSIVVLSCHDFDKKETSRPASRGVPGSAISSETKTGFVSQVSY
jgi:hypothetical protein